MEKLIKFQQEIKEWSLEKLLDYLMRSNPHACGINEETQEKREKEVLVLKLEIYSRVNK